MAAMIPFYSTTWSPELKIEDLQTSNTSHPWPMAGFQNICTEVSSNGPLPKLVKW